MLLVVVVVVLVLLLPPLAKGCSTSMYDLLLVVGYACVHAVVPLGACLYMPAVIVIAVSLFVERLGGIVLSREHAWLIRAECM